MTQGESVSKSRGNAAISHRLIASSDRELQASCLQTERRGVVSSWNFPGGGDRDLVQLGGLTMGPQEKAFRLLCVWRTRCRLGRSQMISQLAVSWRK
ncbi:hypothetical protein OS493_026215 [Desmophyllum pertusum]|uniref:Uncharacterized protein n=1 Tax=Desmophyllum pertusum TaxID=174260 RepID=A0A9X0D1R8_9CNID|nr:hypothetical protein OS493_026215 [Desmophyllum pertusum]